MEEKKKELNKKQKKFCLEYCFDYNATRAAKDAGYSKKTAYSIGHNLLKNVEIQAHIEEIEKDRARHSGISPLLVLAELKALAFSSIGDTNKNWFTLKEFDELSPEIKKTIKETKTEKRTQGTGKDKYVEEIITIKKFDKMKAIEIINKMLGYNIEHLDITSKGEAIKPLTIEVIDSCEKIKEDVENDNE